MANRQTDKNKPDTRKADERKDVLVETVWESFPFPVSEDGSWGMGKKKS